MLGITLCMKLDFHCQGWCRFVEMWCAILFAFVVTAVHKHLQEETRNQRSTLLSPGGWDPFPTSTHCFVNTWNSYYEACSATWCRCILRWYYIFWNRLEDVRFQIRQQIACKPICQGPLCLDPKQRLEFHAHVPADKESSRISKSCDLYGTFCLLHVSSRLSRGATFRHAC